MLSEYLSDKPQFQSYCHFINNKKVKDYLLLSKRRCVLLCE